MTDLLIALGMWLLSNSTTCLPMGFTTDDARTPVAMACIPEYDLGPEAELRYAWRLCQLVDPPTGVCLVDVFPGTVLMGAFDE